MQLSWGGKSGVPLETIFGVTKGIKTEVSVGIFFLDNYMNISLLHQPDIAFVTS